MTEIKRIAYQIFQPETFLGRGQINSIKKQNGSWKTRINLQKNQLIVIIVCQFKHVCEVCTVKIKAKNIKIIDFFYILDGVVQQQTCSWISKEQNEQQIYFPFPQNGKSVKQVQLKLQGARGKQIQITHVFFQGRIFGKRIIEKIVATQQKKAKKKIVQEDPKDHFPDQENEEEQKVPTINRKDQKLKFQKMFDEQDLLQAEQIEQEGVYKLQKIKQSQLQIFHNVSQKWLQAQRKLQSQFGVPIQHMLSQKISKKCLTGMDFCIENIFGEEKAKYVRMIKQLGGYIREQPIPNCIVLASHAKGSSVIRKAKIMANVSIVKLEYLQKCYERRSKLDWKKYKFRESDLIGI